MKNAWTISSIGLLVFASVPAHAALLVNWNTGEYKEVPWEICQVAAQNLSDYQCFGGLSSGDSSFEDEARRAAEKFRGEIPPEPTAAQTRLQLRANHNTTRSNQVGIKAPNDTDGVGFAGTEAVERIEQSSSSANINTSRANKKSSTSDPDSIWETTIPSDDILPISDKRNCIKSGGAWVTNSAGSFCLRSLKR